MSADNGTYIGRFSDGEFRVVHAQAIDNLYYPDGENAFFIWDYYKRATPYFNMDDAMKEAIRINEIVEWTEYGICSFAFEKTFAEYEAEAKKPEYNSYRYDDGDND